MNNWRQIIKYKFFMRLMQIVLAANLLINVSACSTAQYTTYYGMFEAENSAGQWRQFRLYWQAVHREGWGGDSDSVLPVVMETQCSHRKLYFYDQSFARNKQCGDMPGIHYCASAELDEGARGEAVPTGQICAFLTDKSGATMIAELKGDVALTISCRPKVLEKQGPEEKLNMDYLLTSEQPYVIAIKSVKGGGREVENYLPQLFNHSSVCDPDA